MKKIFGLFLFVFFMFSCSQYLDKPEHLISSKKMAEVIADMALNEGVSVINPKVNLESGTRHILKKHQIKPKDFSESYKYYTFTRKLEPILEEAQEIVKEKNPESEKYIEKKLKENNGTPPFAR